MSKQLRGPGKGDKRVSAAKLGERSCLLSPLAQAGSHPCMWMILLQQGRHGTVASGITVGQARDTS